MDVTSKYYFLSSILDDDTYKIAFVIRAYHTKELSMPTVVKHLESLKLTPYADTIDLILSNTKESIIESGKGLIFISESDYVTYLIGLLNLNNVAYARFCKAGELSHIQRSLL